LPIFYLPTGDTTNIEKWKRGRRRMNNRRNRMKKTRWRKWWSVGDISVCNVDLLRACPHDTKISRNFEISEIWTVKFSTDPPNFRNFESTFFCHSKFEMSPKIENSWVDPSPSQNRAEGAKQGRRAGTGV
jgi:hypothetical protein